MVEADTRILDIVLQLQTKEVYDIRVPQIILL